MFVQWIGNVVKDIEIGEQCVGLEQYVYLFMYCIKM